MFHFDFCEEVLSPGYTRKCGWLLIWIVFVMINKLHKSNNADCSQYRNKTICKSTEKSPLTVNLCLALQRKWEGIYVTLENGGIVLLGATLEPLCWSRWLGTNSPGLCKSRWHWILSWESRALYHKETPCARGNTHTHTQIPFPPPKGLAIHSWCDKRPCDSMRLGRVSTILCKAAVFICFCAS